VDARVADMNANGVLALDELSDDGRLQRPYVHRVQGQRDRAGHAAGLQRLGHRRVGRLVPRPVHLAGHRPDVGHRPRRRRGASARCQGLPFDQLPRDPARPGVPELPLRPLGPHVPGHHRREHGPVIAHRCRLRRHSEAQGGACRPSHGARLPDQRHHRPGPPVRADTAEVPRPEGGSVGGRHRLDPLLP